MRCPTCAPEVSAGGTCSASGAALPAPPLRAAPAAAVLATTPAASAFRWQLRTRNPTALAGALFPLFPSQSAGPGGIGNLFGD